MHGGEDEVVVGLGFGEGAVARVVCLSGLLLLAAAVTVFAGGADSPRSRTFGAYEVDFDCGSVGVTIKGHASEQSVTIAESNVPSGENVHFDETGGILRVTASGTGGGSLIVTMPRYEFVHIQTTSGPVSIDNLSTDHLSVRTETGDIGITNTNAALSVESTTGNQRMDQIYGAINATTTSGNVAVSNTWGIMKLVTQSGSLTGAKVDIAGASSFETTSGAISVALAYGLSSARYSLSLRSGGGTIRLGDIQRTGSLRWGNGNIAITATSASGSEDFR